MGFSEIVRVSQRGYTTPRSAEIPVGIGNAGARPTGMAALQVPCVVVHGAGEASVALG